jgi:uncharacterized protein YecT (DUF1311 family)
MRLSILVGILSFHMVSVGADAQTRDTELCPDAQTQFAMNQCASRVFQTADAKLNRAYARIFAARDTSRRPQLRSAQRSWIRFRDAYCRDSVSLYEGGREYPMQYAFCLAAVTEERTQQLLQDEKDEADLSR